MIRLVNAILFILFIPAFSAAAEEPFPECEVSMEEILRAIETERIIKEALAKNPQSHNNSKKPKEKVAVAAGSLPATPLLEGQTEVSSSEPTDPPAKVKPPKTKKIVLPLGKTKPVRQKGGVLMALTKLKKPVVAK